VLIAEDNEINQLVARRIFQKLGHKVKVVNNGREALSAVQVRPFDLVAMDVHMPEMDGLDATIAIRDLERKTGTHIPIIAMTAHAMKGDRERCLAAGMDGYVSKPIRSLALAKAISEVMSRRRAGKEPARIVNQTDSAINEAALLEGVDGNRRLLRKLVKLFLADYPLHLAQIKDALRDGDAEALATAAHTLKGAIGNFAAKKAVAAAQLMEVLARDGELRAASQAYSGLESELAPLVEELKRIVTNPAKRKPRANQV
jgi:CheY-like chemotaxis protein/HPt (histidine-containing phosphotransfer) domain-containing protein